MPRILDRPRALLALTGACALATAAACGDITNVKAQFSDLEARPVVYAMNSAAVTLPAAIAVRSVQAVRIDATFLFDIAFDLDSLGAVVVYSQSRVASQLIATHRVGMQLVTTDFASTLRAPGGGYVYDTTMVLPAGQTMLIDVIESSCAGSFLGSNIRAKLSVDSVQVANRAIFLHILSNPNCGFRDLVQGLPKD